MDSIWNNLGKVKTSVEHSKAFQLWVPEIEKFTDVWVLEFDSVVFHSLLANFVIYSYRVKDIAVYIKVAKFDQKLTSPELSISTTIVTLI